MTPHRLQEEFDIITEASAAAKAAAYNHITANPNVWWPCGFSWVRIRPARGRFVSALKELGIGQVDDFEGGYVVYNPSGNSTQWMDAKVEGSRAFAAVLEKHGIKATVGSRID